MRAESLPVIRSFIAAQCVTSGSFKKPGQLLGWQFWLVGAASEHLPLRCASGHTSFAKLVSHQTSLGQIAREPVSSVGVDSDRDSSRTDLH